MSEEVKKKRSYTYGKVQFLAIKEDILALVAKGYPLSQVHSILSSSGKITMSYATLCIYMQNLRKNEKHEAVASSTALAVTKALPQQTVPSQPQPTTATAVTPTLPQQATELAVTPQQTTGSSLKLNVLPMPNTFQQTQATNEVDHGDVMKVPPEAEKVEDKIHSNVIGLKK